MRIVAEEQKAASVVARLKGGPSPFAAKRPASATAAIFRRAMSDEGSMKVGAATGGAGEAGQGGGAGGCGGLGGDFGSGGGDTGGGAMGGSGGLAGHSSMGGFSGAVSTPTANPAPVTAATPVTAIRICCHPTLLRKPAHARRRSACIACHCLLSHSDTRGPPPYATLIRLRSAEASAAHHLMQLP